MQVFLFDKFIPDNLHKSPGFRGRFFSLDNRMTHMTEVLHIPVLHGQGFQCLPNAAKLFYHEICTKTPNAQWTVPL